MSEKTYRVNALFLKKNPNAVTQINGTGIAFGPADYIEKIEASLGAPPKERVFRAATQEDLAHLYEVEKHPFVELVSEKKVSK
ncbi:MAG: hypothetical protein ACRCVX_14210 [Shewanella sp.]